MELLLVITLVLGSFLVASVLNYLINRTDTKPTPKRGGGKVVDLESAESESAKDRMPEVQD